MACTAGGFPEGLHRKMCCVFGRPETTENLARLLEDLGAESRLPRWLFIEPAAVMIS